MADGYEMSRVHRQVLTRNLVYLTRNVHADVMLLGHLQQSGTLMPRHVERLKVSGVYLGGGGGSVL